MNNPIKYIIMDNKVAMRVGNFTFVTKEKNNKLRNLICSELNIKKCVFSKKGEKKS